MKNWKTSATATLGGLLVAASGLPAALWLTFLVAAIYAHQHLGYWPSYGHPDPKDLPAAVQSASETLERLVFFLSMLIPGLTFAFVHRSQQRIRRAILFAIAIAIVYALFGVSLCYYDPFGVFEWGID
jgi:hypothetical protein